MFWGVGGICSGSVRVGSEALSVTMILTRTILHSAGTVGVGFNRAQLSLLGVSWPPQKGWLSRLVGTEVPEETWQTVLRLRGVRRRVERQRVMQDSRYNPRMF